MVLLLTYKMLSQQEGKQLLLRGSRYDCKRRFYRKIYARGYRQLLKREHETGKMNN